MASRDQLHRGDTGLLTVFARAPQLCAGALAGLGSALWLNVVGPFAGLVAAWGALVLVNALAVAVVAVLAMLVTTAGTLLAADWRADAAGRQAWAEMEYAEAELCLPVATVVPSQIDPRYLTASDNEALRSVFRARRFTSLALASEASTHTPAANPATRIVATSGALIAAIAVTETAHSIACKISATAAYRKASSTPVGHEPLVVASRRARPQVLRAAASTTRRVANGGAWSEWAALDRPLLTRQTTYGHIADIVVLSGDRGDRDQRCAGPSTSDGTVRSGEPPSCRGPPSAAGQQTRARETTRVESAGPVQAAGTLPIDPIVRDNLGYCVPVCAAELDVIETYLDQVLRDLLASGTPAPGGETS